MPKVGNTSVLTKKSQITIPKKVREFLKLHPGDEVKFQIEENVVKLIPIVINLENGFGKVNTRGKTGDFQKIRNQAESITAEEVMQE